MSSVAVRSLVVSCLSVSLAAGLAAARPFTYDYFPTSTTVTTAYTTDFQIVGYSGGQYNEDTFAREFTGPSSPTVTFAAGAEIPDAEVFNSSVVRVSGGTVSAVAYDNSTVNIHSGTAVYTLGFEASVINVFGGQCGQIDGQGSFVNVSGGSIGILTTNGRSAPDGTQLGSCIAEVTGGMFTQELNAFNQGVMNFRGGQIAGATLRAAEGGTLNIFGTNLVAQLIDPNAPSGYSLYTLSGQLADGSPLNGVQMRIRNDGVTYGHSTFNLVNVPTPGVAALPAMLLVATGARRRLRR